MDMENLEDLFAENCFLPCVGEIEPVLVRKDLDTLLKELNAIEENIEEIKARQEIISRNIFLHEGYIPS